MTKKISKIPSRIENAQVDELGNPKEVTGAKDILDDEKGKRQNVINKEVDEAIGNDETPGSIKGRIKGLENQVGEGGTVDERIAEEGAKHYLKSETYNKTELNNLITTPEVNYVNVEATDQTASISDVLPATGAANTIYKIGNWDGTQYDTSKYTEYAWDGSAYIPLATRDHGVDDEPTVGSDNLAKSGGIANKYGDYNYIGRNLIYAFLDSLNRVVWAIKKNGSMYFPFGIPDQVQEQLDLINGAISDIQAYIESVKPIIDELAVVDCGYWIEAKVTSDNKVLTGIRRSDGAFYAMNIESPTIDAINNIISGSFSVTKSIYIDEEQDTADLTLEVPVLSADATLVEVETEEQLNAAITRYNNGENLLISLKGNIGITTAKSIIGSNAELTINGNGYAIYQKATEYTPSGYKGGVAYTNAAFPDISRIFVTEDAKIIPYTRSKFYDAAGRITDSEGNTFPGVNDGTSAGVRKFLLPEELRSLSIGEADNVYINFSCWFVAYNSKVIKIEDGYLYFQYQGGYNVDGDYYFAKKYTSFCFINLDINFNGIAFKNNKAYFDSSISKVYNCGNFAGFVISNNTGKVKIMNVNFKGASSSNPFINNLRSTLLLENCSFEGFQYICVQNRTFDTNDPTDIPQATLGKVYVNNCLFENVYHGGIMSAIDTICVVTNSIFKNVGINRSNSASIRVLGQYYVAYNTIEDFHYNGITVGIVSMAEQHNCLGIIEKNILRQSTKYALEANHKTVMDSGAIYVGPNNVNTVIRKNKIINYFGRKNNNGIFCDDGAYNFKIYSNIIENTPNANAISARYATGRSTAGNTDNVNKVIAQNVVTNSILIGGNPNVAENGCVLDVNIITDMSKPATVSNVEHVESQIYTIGVKLVNGACQSPVSLENWNIN